MKIKKVKALNEKELTKILGAASGNGSSNDSADTCTGVSSGGSCTDTYADPPKQQ